MQTLHRHWLKCQGAARSVGLSPYFRLLGSQQMAGKAWWVSGRRSGKRRQWHQRHGSRWRSEVCLAVGLMIRVLMRYYRLMSGRRGPLRSIWWWIRLKSLFGNLIRVTYFLAITRDISFRDQPKTSTQPSKTTERLPSSTKEAIAKRLLNSNSNSSPHRTSIHTRRTNSWSLVVLYWPGAVGDTVCRL